MPKFKPFKIEVPNAETAAWLYAMVEDFTKFHLDWRDALEEYYPDEYYDQIDSNVKTSHLQDQIDLGLTDNGLGDVVSIEEDIEKLLTNFSNFNDTPNRLDGNMVEYSSRGVQVGCVYLTTEQMKNMVKKCEEE